MWMTWNSRARRGRFAAASVAALFAACASGSGNSTIAPDAARPARVVPVDRSGAGEPVSQGRPVELTSVRLRLARRDTALARMAGPALLQRANDVVAVEVTTTAPLGNVNRNASPEIYLDGVRIGDTWALPPTRLVAFVTDRQRLRAGVAVTVAWLGDEQRTRTRQPIVLTADQVNGIQ
jgi:hypothetical protein